jgi:hypothetical protein
VLLFEPLAAHQPLLLELDGSGSAEPGMVLADGSLLLVLNPAAGNGSSSGAEPSQHAALAAAVVAWLLQPLAANGGAADPPDEIVRQLRHRLSAACAGEAADALSRFVSAAEAAPSQPVPASLASRAAQVARLLHTVAAQQQQQQQESSADGSPGAAAPDPLAAAHSAWAAAHQLLADPGTGASQAFPPEHAMAVLLPLALPVTLVLLQAAGREVAAWKGRRVRQRGPSPRPGQ